MIKTKNAILYFLSSVIIIVFVVLPVLQNFLVKYQEVKIKRQELRQEEKHIEDLKKAESELEKYLASLEMIDKAISDDPAIASLVYFIERSCQNSGMFLEDVKSFTVEESEIFPGLKETTLEFSVSGNYNDFKRLLNSMENSVKVIKTEKFSIRKSEDEKKQALSFDVIIKTYSY